MSAGKQGGCVTMDAVPFLLRLKTLAVLAGGLTKMLGAVTAEVREGGKIHQLGYLGERQASTGFRNPCAHPQSISA